MNYLAELAYDGSKFYGFQRLNDLDSVQKKLEEALAIIDKSPVVLKGAGRTDRGVHALGQRITFNLTNEIPCTRLKTALNGILGPYIYIKNIKKVPADFHARFNVKTKTYVYKIYTKGFDPLKYDYYLIKDNIDIKKLKEAAKLFIGPHNFQNFVSGERPNYDSIIYSIKVTKNSDEVLITIKGSSFYRYMIRNIVGAMLAFNDDKTDIETINRLLNGENSVKRLPVASPNGLYLTKITY